MTKNNWTQIKVLALDVDGVLTDGGVYYSARGEEMLRFNRIDGKGIELLKKIGVHVWIVSAEDSQITRRRCEKLGIEQCFVGIKDKLAHVKAEAARAGIALENICFMGDDVQDMEVMCAVGASASPVNAVDAVKRMTRYLCVRQGGHGAVREVVDLILGAKG